MYTNHRHYILLLLAIGAVTLSGIGYAVLYHAITSQSIKAHDALKTIALADERKKLEEDTASLYAKTKDERSDLGNLIISQEKIVDFIKSVEKIGDDVNVQLELSAITNEPISAEDIFSYFKGHIEAHGSWANIMRTLILVENMPYAISLYNVKLAQSAESSSTKLPTKVWDLSFDIRVLMTK